MKDTIKKIDAAQRQLDTAIDLWFREADPISVHTLACSAYQVIHDINTHKKGRDLLYDTLVVKDEYRRDFITRIKATYNFFKHANQDPDPDGTIEFDPASTKDFIIFTILGLELNGVKSTNIRRLFLIHYSIHNTRCLTEKGKEFLNQNIPSEILDDIRKLTRYEFFEEMDKDFMKKA
jgi:hypothetical protein